MRRGNFWGALEPSDEESMPDCLAGLAASAAIAVSDIPFQCPISEVRVARTAILYLLFSYVVTAIARRGDTQAP